MAKNQDTSTTTTSELDMATELYAVAAQLRLMREAIGADGKTANDEFLRDVYATLDGVIAHVRSIADARFADAPLEVPVRVRRRRK